jgi:hypothetical protein
MARTAGQQGPHLLGVAGIVQEHEHPSTCQQAPAQGGPRVGVQRDPRRRQAQGFEQTADRLGPADRQSPRIKAAQVDEQLTIGQALGDLMCPVDRQGRLAYPGRAADDRYV